MSAQKMAAITSECGLSVVGQELVTWGTALMLIDCMTTLRLGAQGGPVGTHSEPNFMAEAHNWKRLGAVYGPGVPKNAQPLSRSATNNGSRPRLTNMSIFTRCAEVALIRARP